jgi:hypothetical protein
LFTCSGGLVNGGGLQAHGSSSSSSGATSPNRELWNTTATGTSGAASTSSASGTSTIGKEGQYQPTLPPVAAEVLRTAYERHRRGLMSPYIYQLLTQVNIRIFIEIERFIHFKIDQFY